MSGVGITDLAPCEICGHPVKVDAIVANDVFAKISPTGDENGYFCANCMVERLNDKLGWGTVYLSQAPGLEPLAALRSQVSALTEERDRLRSDCAILLSEIDWLEECTGEGADGEGRALVEQIRADLAPSDAQEGRADG